MRRASVTVNPLGWGLLTVCEKRWTPPLYLQGSPPPRDGPWSALFPREDSFRTAASLRRPEAGNEALRTRGLRRASRPRSRDYNSQAAPRRRHVTRAPPAAPGSCAGGGRGCGRAGGGCRGWGPPGRPAREEAKGRATPAPPGGRVSGCGAGGRRWSCAG